MRRGLVYSLAWVGFGLLSWGAYLAFPRVPGDEPGPGLRVVMVDASASAVRRRPGWGGWVRELVRQHEEAASLAGEEFSVVLFGRDVLRLREEAFGGGVGWLDPAFEQASFGAGSELRSAISSVELELIDPQRYPGRLVILGDGEWTGQDPRPLIARLARSGVECSRVDPGAARWPDLGIVDLRLPPSIGALESLAVVCDLVYSPGEVDVEGALWVEMRDSVGYFKEKRDLALPAGGGSWSVSVDLMSAPEGPVEVEAWVELKGDGALSAGDPVGENDRAWGRTRSGEALLGLATSEEARRGELEAWLELSGGDGIHWKVVPLSEVGRELPEHDIFLSYDVSTAALPEEWLGPFLENGGGWLAAGGWGLLADFWPQGVADSAPSSDWLPLAPAASDVPEREVIFCVDGSGSMAGEPFESVRGALVQLVRAALPSDRLQMRFFTGALGPVVEIGGGGQGDRVEGLRELLGARVPGGSTDILRSMETLADSRSGSELPGLVLLLSDGRDDSSFQVAERSAAIRRSLAESHTSLSVIGIGAEADIGMLDRLAGDSADVVVVEELVELADLFRREVARERVREGAPTAVTIHGGAASEDVQALVSALAVRREWPPVGRLGRMETRPGAHALLRTAEGLPLLGLGRVGEGWAAAFPSLPLVGWAGDYLGASDVWVPLWRLLGRSGSDDRGGPSLAVHGDELVLSLGDEGESWPPIVHVELKGVEADGRARSLGGATLSLDDGGVARSIERRVGELGHLESGGGALLRAHIRDAEGGDELAVLPLERPLEAEFRPFRGTALRSGRLSGSLATNQRDVQASPDPRAPLVLGVAMALLALSALFGRWRAEWGEGEDNNSESAFRPPG